MRVVGYDPVTTPEVASQHGVRLKSLDEIFRSADVITVHTPLNENTRHLIDSRAFSMMKDGVMIVNCARGRHRR